MKPALTGRIEIQNSAEFETALMAVERLMEVAEDSEMDPLDPLIRMLFSAIQAWEAKDPTLAFWDDEADDGTFEGAIREGLRDLKEGRVTEYTFGVKEQLTAQDPPPP